VSDLEICASTSSGVSEAIWLRVKYRWRDFSRLESTRLEMVDQIFTSWNPLTGWIRRIGEYRAVA
jgi:hypothetical protein